MSDFDITRYEWSDSGIEDCGPSDGVVQIYNPEQITSIGKADAIALAKHFKLTEADLC